MPARRGPRDSAPPRGATSRGARGGPPGGGREELAGKEGETRQHPHQVPEGRGGGEGSCAGCGRRRGEWYVVVVVIVMVVAVVV
eukprot:1577469-Alexandrium_andersonii.AAC.1